MVLSHNKLSSLPEGIFDDLESLVMLYLNDNLLTDLSTYVFTYLTNLTLLLIEDNQLYAFSFISSYLFTIRVRHKKQQNCIVT